MRSRRPVRTTISPDLEDVERRLTAYEEKIFAGLMVEASEDELLEIRQARWIANSHRTGWQQRRRRIWRW